jgi:hypothetical protein
VLRRLLLPFVLGGCSSASTPASTPAEPRPRPDAPIVAAQPGAWFDSDGNLSVVGAGRRLRLSLSAPITACAPAFEGDGSPEQVVERASLTFRVLSDACRDEHPQILLPAESETASPAELERSYREVARCVSDDIGMTSGWVPALLAARDPCPGVLGLGWRLPRVTELQGLGLDERKAVAGALFDTEDRAAFGSLLLYAHDDSGKLALATLSPNAAEQPPSLNDALASKPLFGAALRCVRDGLPAASAPRGPSPEQLPELQKLKAWIRLVTKSPALLQNEATLRELSSLLASPPLERLAQDAREERALTERYAELAENLDDPEVAEAERERRRTEFDGLRKRLSGKIVQSAVVGGADRGALSAVLAHTLQLLEEAAARAGKTGKSGKARPPDYAALLVRVRELRGEKAKAP